MAMDREATGESATGGMTDHSLISLSLCFRWIIGAAVGTALIAVTSPVFVRSYVPLQKSSVRGVWVLSPGKNYRWRSEGYADTHVGEHGLPGKQLPGKPLAGKRLAGKRLAGKMATVSGAPRGFRIALWGDSQAEGVAVADDEKLFAALQDASDGLMDVYPFARSGEDAADWVTQMPRVEKHWGIDAHVFLIVELSDLFSAREAPLPPPSEDDVAAGQAALAARLPAFVIQAARNLLTEQDGTTRRRLRFSIGPVKEHSRQEEHSSRDERGSASPLSVSTRKTATDWQALLQPIRSASEKPIIVIYAPISPMIRDGKITVDSDSPQATDFLAMRDAAESQRIRVLDVRSDLRRSADHGNWPHGFHNGRIGSGHLNARGYRVIAQSIADEILDTLLENDDATVGQGL